MARSVGLSVGAISGTLHRAGRGAHRLAAVEAVPDAVLAARLYHRRDGGARARPRPDCAYNHTERRKPGVTLQLLIESVAAVSARLESLPEIGSDFPRGELSWAQVRLW